MQLLSELTQESPSPLKKELQGLHTHILSALPRLLLFARDLDEIQQHCSQTLGSEALGLLGWAWQRREILGPSTEELLLGFPPDWRAQASALFAAWGFAVRAVPCR